MEAPLATGSKRWWTSAPYEGREGTGEGSDVEYVSFGRAGIKVSRLALGLGLRGQSDETAAEQLIYAALDSGINLFDCANVYGLMDDRTYAGRSEVILGRALKGRRDEVVITSKVCSAVGKGPNDAGGSRYEVKNGRFTGKADILKSDRKPIFLKELVTRHNADWQGSIGVGDSEGDMPMLSTVEQPIAFNPTRELFEHARREQWKVVVERKNMIYHLEPKNGSFVLAQTDA